MTPVAPPAHHPFSRRISSVVERAIQARPSFRDILDRARLLDLGHGDASSPHSIACYFLRKQQDSLDALLLEQQHLQRIGLRSMMNLLLLSSLRSWKASLLCGSLYKSILDANLSITRVQTILEAPFPLSQVDDLAVYLNNLQDLFSDQTLKEIEDCKALFFELDCEIKRYQHRLRVRALSRIRDLDQRAQHGMSRYRHAMRELKAYLTSRFTVCNTGMTIASNSDGEEELLTPGTCPDGDDDFDDDEFDVAADDGAVAQECKKPAFTGFTSLHKAHMRLHKVKTCLSAVNYSFDTLKPMVRGTHSQMMNQMYIESLRNEPLMFYGVAERISGCHASLSKHLDDLREQVLNTFCYINNARELVYSL